MRRWTGTVALLLLGASPVLAEEGVDPASLYEVSTEGSSTVLQPGQTGRFVLRIEPRGEAHVSTDAPLRLQLEGRGVQVAQARLGLADARDGRAEGQAHPAPRFEVPITAGAAGAAAVEARLSFYICTATLCARQQRTLHVPVQVGGQKALSPGAQVR